MDNRPIGVFDSGVGGLSVLKKVVEVLPEEEYIYVGDTKRLPYGEKTPEEIKKYTAECVEYLYNRNVKAIIIACNTASSYGLEYVKELFDIPIVGVVDHASMDAIELTKNKNIALLATEATVNSGIYNRYIDKLDPEVTLRSLGAPDLVIAIEESHLDDEHIEKIIKGYLDEFNSFEYDTLVLACTHFPLARDAFKRVIKSYNYDRKIRLVDPAFTTVQSLKDILAEKNQLGNLNTKKVEFLITDDVDKFKKVFNNTFPKNGVVTSFEELNIY
nr:glutamate racemase [Anaerosphaera multitolerans]